MVDKGAATGYEFILSRRTDVDDYGLWRWDMDDPDLLSVVPLPIGVNFDRTHQIISVGGYLLEWGPVALSAYQPCYPYRLFEFDPTSPDPLAGKPVQKGAWTKTKFWYSRADFGNPGGANKSFEAGAELTLLALGNFVLNVIPTVGRGTHQLWNFDPSPLKAADPLPASYTPQGSFNAIQYGSRLLPIGNFVLEWSPSTDPSSPSQYWLWSVDPQNAPPLALPTIQQGEWSDIDSSHELVVLGEHVLDWVPSDRTYRVWRFDPKSANPLTGPLRAGVLPAGFDASTTLMGIETKRPIDPVEAKVPGTMDFMRSRIKHIVYLMVENRSFDHICGWLYDKGETGINFVGKPGPFDGASLDMFNINLGGPEGDNKVFLEKYNDGKPSDDVDLDFLTDDPYHDNSDVLRQYYFQDPKGYAKRATPNMGGFVWNNGSPKVMWTYTPEQIPIVNGLARNFAVSDEWFSSTPGATDANRAFAFTGSSLGQLNNFQNGIQYTNWPLSPHRASMWKTLWSNGITDWKIYNSVEWMGFIHTYHLYLAGTIPYVDANIGDYTAGIQQFKEDALAGNLPAFSLLEPIWISLTGTTSYHPGADLVPGERALNEIYEAIKAGPAWEETLLVVTFDEHGGLFDHVPPPAAENPWPNDVIDGFHFDVMGVRVPTVLVSPLIEQQTVFRSSTPVPYDSTSFMATLLEWQGIPRSRWGLGQRVHNAPSFEGVLQRHEARDDAPTLKPPHDKQFDESGISRGPTRLHDLHQLMLPRLVWSIAQGKLSAEESNRISDEMLSTASDLQALHKLVDALAKRLQ